MSEVTQDEADQTLELLLHYGVNHIDVAARYGDAEMRIAPWLQKHPGAASFSQPRPVVALYDDAKRDIRPSLELMGGGAWI